MAERHAWPDRRAIWRWHFYAGIVCIPFVLWLAATGSIYLFRQQIETAIDAPYDHLHAAAAAPPSAQVAAALAHTPGARLSAYELSPRPDMATRILLDAHGAKIRVYVHPATLGILKSVREDDRFTRRLFRLHGELMAGNTGSAVVEIAACWAIVLILTGLILWWPVGQRGLGGVLWPRFHLGGRTAWRDVHAVTGFWVSFCALFLLSTGLPWAKYWGDYFKEVRQITHTADGPQDWTNGAARVSAGDDMHADHDMPMMQSMTARMAFDDGLDRVVATAARLHLAPPVLVSPPTQGSVWRVKSDAANRPLRVDVRVDAMSGDVIGRRAFSQRHPIDQAIGYGVAAHEGQLFGPANLIVSLSTALGLIALCVSAAVMWLRRRPASVLGAPEMLQRPRFAGALVVVVAVLAILFPLMGASLAFIFLADRLVLRHVPPLRAWLDLDPVSERW